MKKHIIPIMAAIAACMTANAQGFETAQDAVNNMRIGWNVGNRLDVHSGPVDNMWIEAWTEHTPDIYETAWGEPIITPELIRMFKDAGFNAIRVPVTWYPHMGNVIVDPSKTDWKPIWDMSTWTGYDIDPVWMARVREVVDYVINEGMYCIINVHHDTGEASTAWLRADEVVYIKQKERFEALWTQIATEFRDYDEHLLFEGYNEMLDPYGSWCFASLATSGNYNQSVANSAYNAINSYAQSFVNAVRATGGNNSERNLVVNTYGACSGEGDWSPHLKDPLKEMKVPADITENHIIFEIHAYPTPTSVSSAKYIVDNLLAGWKEHLQPKCPVILGEWGILDESARPYLNDMGEYLVSRCKEEGIATFLWREAADGDDCSVPQWTNPGLKDAIVKGYYGEEGYNHISSIESDSKHPEIYTLDGIRVNEATAPGIYIIKQGDKTQKIVKRP